MLMGCEWLQKGEEDEKFFLRFWKQESVLLGIQGQDFMFNSPPSPADSVAAWRPWRSSNGRKQAQFQSIHSKVFINAW